VSETKAAIKSVFRREDAIRLANLSSKKFRSPFENKPDLLLKIIRKAELEYNRVCSDAEFDEIFFEDGRLLKQLAEHFGRFKYYWDRTDTSARDEIGFFGKGDKTGIEYVADNNEMICEALELLDAGLKGAIEYRSDDPGRRDNRPGLKEFVGEVYRGWKGEDPTIPFGHLFNDALEGDDRVPVSSAAKLIVEAMKILDPDVKGRDCETAIKAIKTSST
jgi:hypothetical protein